MSQKKFLTTGEVAKYCGVNFRTVIRWIEKGRLKAHKLPGRGDNRVSVEDFIVFLKDNQLPVPKELSTQDQQRVLVIDDEPSMALSIKRVLERSGYEVKCVSNGIEAGVALESFNPSVITLDLQMPKMDGYELLSFLNDNPQYSHIKVLVVSGVDDVALDEARRAGADQVLQKPFLNEILIRYVAELFSLGR